MWLAESNNFLPKGIFVVLAIAVWAISTAVKSIKTQREQQLAPQRLAGLQIPPVPVRNVARSVGRATPGRRAAPPAARPVQRQPQPQQRRVAQPAKRTTLPPVPPMATASSRGTQAGNSGVKPSAAPRVANADAASIRQWLRPETLRGQFIISEILQPPVSMRPPDERNS